MKVKFNIEYRTRWGESLHVVGSPAALGAGCLSAAAPMTSDGGSGWHLEIDLPEGDFEYSYVMRDESGREIREWGKPHKFLCGGDVEYIIHDRWQDMPADKPFYSSAFTQCTFHRENPDPHKPFQAATLTLQVAAPKISPDLCVAVCGASQSLGCWDVAKAIRLSDAYFPLWTVNLTVSDDLVEGTEYKFLIIDKTTGEAISWEGGENRRLSFTPSPSASNVEAGMRLRNERRLWHGAGTAIPVFSLRSDDDFGVGEFFDLMPMADWAAATGQTFIQILPINDTTMCHGWSDSYPYNVNSTFALHPQYLRLSAMGCLNDAGRQQHYKQIAEELNALPEIDYERVNNTKNSYTRELFEQDGAATISSPEFQTFLARNREWLIPYAAFCVLRDRFGTPDFRQWEQFASYDENAIKEFVEQNAADVQYVYYIQYHLDKQMRRVRDYAHSKGVAIKGDIPIGISSTSVDAWIHPELFFLKSQAGAPPDDFAVLGQNWGFPTYNWKEMEKDGYAWWKSRFRKMSEYFDAYRIDHVLGFFRIWEIPVEQYHGLLGHFNPALPFSPEELSAGYDFSIDPEMQTLPYITDAIIDDTLGAYADDARAEFFEPIAGSGRYRLKPEFDTQRKVALYFENTCRDERTRTLCEGLMNMIDDVLFIEDPDQHGTYHPRISALDTQSYKALSDYEQACFERLYNDFYYHRHNDFWQDQAMRKLPPLIDSTDMLVCAEDLGMIPACVPVVMKKLEMLSLEIQRMPKEAFATFGDTWKYPYYSVCTTSTHDMSGIRGWWEEDRELTQKFYNDVLRQSGDAPLYAEPWICEKILQLHLKSPSMLCIIPLQDWLSIDGNIRRANPHEERINVPADSRHYWRYRMHLSIAELQQQSDFNSRLRSLIGSSGR